MSARLDELGGQKFDKTKASDCSFKVKSYFRLQKLLLKGCPDHSSFLELDQTCALRVSTIPLVSAIVSAFGVGS